MQPTHIPDELKVAPRLIVETKDIRQQQMAILRQIAHTTTVIDIDVIRNAHVQHLKAWDDRIQAKIVYSYTEMVHS